MGWSWWANSESFERRLVEVRSTWYSMFVRALSWYRGAICRRLAALCSMEREVKMLGSAVGRPQEEYRGACGSD